MAGSLGGFRHRFPRYRAIPLCSLLLVTLGTLLAQRRVPTLPIVEHLDVFEHARLCLVTSLIVLVVDQFLLRRRDERHPTTEPLGSCCARFRACRAAVGSARWRIGCLDPSGPPAPPPADGFSPPSLIHSPPAGLPSSPAFQASSASTAGGVPCPGKERWPPSTRGLANSVGGSSR